MFHVFRSRKQVMRIMLGVIVAPIIITMVVTLIPGITSTTTSGDMETVMAQVGNDTVTFRDTQQEYQGYVEQRKVPAGGYSFLAPKILQDLIVNKAMLQEAERLGLGATDEELADLLRISLPMLYQGGNFLGQEIYAAMVQERFQKTVPEFEAALKQSLILDTKLRGLVTDGIFVSQA